MLWSIRDTTDQLTVLYTIILALSPWTRLDVLDDRFDWQIIWLRKTERRLESLIIDTTVLRVILQQKHVINLWPKLQFNNKLDTFFFSVEIISSMWNRNNVFIADCIEFFFLSEIREKAYIYAISSAGIMYSITRSCAKGELDNCGCDMKVRRKDTKGQFEWGGCSENTKYGAKFSRKFVDTKESTTKTATSLMNLWNNEAGRKVKDTWYAKKRKKYILLFQPRKSFFLYKQNVLTYSYYLDSI